MFFENFAWINAKDKTALTIFGHEIHNNIKCDCNVAELICKGHETIISSNIFVFFLCVFIFKVKKTFIA